MYTKTSKQILGPVAETISELILLNSDAEMRNVALPDLTGAAVAVDAQAENLCQICQSMIEFGDDQLKKEMPVACNVVSNGGKTISSAAMDLRLDPLSKQGRLNLLKACKQIIEGTANLLAVYDDSEIRKIVNCCKATKLQLEKLKQTKTMDSLIESIKPCCDGLVEVTQLSKKRVDELIYQSLQERLQAAYGGLGSLSELLVSSCKAVAQNFNDTETFASRAICCDRITNLMNEIEIVVQIRQLEDKDEKNLAGNRNDIYQILANIMTAVKSKDSKGLNDNIAALNTVSAPLFDNSLNAAKLNDGENGKALGQLVDSLKGSVAQTKVIAQAAISDKANGPEGLYNALVDSSGKFSQLESLTDRVIAENIRSNVFTSKDHQDASTTIGKVYNAIKAGDKVKAQSEIKKFKEKKDELVKSLETAASIAPTQDIQRTVLNKTENLNLAHQQLTAAISNQPSTDNEVMRQYVDNVVNSWEDAVTDAGKIVYNPEIFSIKDVIAADESSLKKSSDKFNESLTNNDISGAKEGLEDSVLAVKRVLSAIQKEKDGTDDTQYKKELSPKIDTLQNAITNLKPNSSLSDPSDQVKYKKELETAKSAVSDIYGLVSQRAGKPNNEVIIEPVSIKKNSSDPKSQNISKTEIYPEEYGNLSKLLDTFKAAAMARDKAQTNQALNGSNESLKNIKNILSNDLVNATQESSKNDLKSKISFFEKAIQNLEKSKNEVSAFKPAAVDSVKASLEESVRLAKDLVAKTSLTKSQSQIIDAKKQVAVEEKPASFVTLIDGVEVQVVDEDLPRHATADEVKSNPIQAAAKDLEATTKRWSIEDSPLLKGSLSLAEKMTALSSLYKDDTPQSKKTMIEIAKGVHEDCKNLLEQIKQVADACTDKSLKSQLLVAMNSISSFSMQLKIVTSVKAAGSKDVDSEKQLILCCQHLMGSIEKTLKTSEIAAKRTVKGIGQAVQASMKFRKVLYRTIKEKK